MLRDYTPEVGVDLHEGDSEDLPILTSRHLNVYEPLFREGKDGLVEGWMYDNAAQSRLVARPVQQRAATATRASSATRSGSRTSSACWPRTAPSGGNTRPAEGTQLANRNRKSYGSLWEEFNDARVLLAAAWR